MSIARFVANYRLIAFVINQSNIKTMCIDFVYIVESVNRRLIKSISFKKLLLSIMLKLFSLEFFDEINILLKLAKERIIIVGEDICAVIIYSICTLNYY